MSDRCDVTVVIPTYNRGKELLEAVASVRAQHCQPAAIIVVDDGSDDPRAVDALELAVHHGAEIVRRHSRGGPGAARNSGVALASTKWIAFLDDDDLWLPDHLSQAHRLLDGMTTASYATSVHVLDTRLGGNAVWYRSPEPRVPEPGRAGLLSQLPWPELVTSSWVVSTDAWRLVGGMDSDTIIEDFATWWKLVGAGVPVVRGADPQVIYRWHQGNASSLEEHRNNLLPAVSRTLLDLEGDAADGDVRHALRRWAEAARNGTYPKRRPLQPSTGPEEDWSAILHS
jgi:glycosyltransferase involved in cell wall biosynthesis